MGVFCFAQNKASDIKWIKSNLGGFQINIEPHTRGMMSPNLAMQFNGVFQMLRQNVEWMIPGKVNVEVYQDKKSFLTHNRDIAEDWSGALFDPGRNIIVMYDEPKQQRQMMKKFTHELTHLFVENTFNPPNSKAPPKEPPVWLNEGLAVNMEDIAQTPNGDVWNNDLIVINIFSGGEYEILKKRKETGGGLSQKEKDGLRKFAVSDKVVFFQNFVDFIEPDSYDKALEKGKIDDWYLQAYAMVRFLFRPNNSQTPSKRMQFKQFMETLAKYSPKKDATGRLVLTPEGKKIMVRPNEEAALKIAYKYKNILEFEEAFWHWLTTYQAIGRKKIKDNIKGK
ncbi:MAG: hypothetical protein II726_02330 [Elusimicrobiaceae bacterium]|nr:hypothetical protein [Elusimicrobiaceae bacterium]